MLRAVRWWVAAAMWVAALGCGGALEPEVEELVGVWEWVQSSGGIAGITLTPASTGETMTMTFRADGTVELVRTGVADRSTTYTLAAATDGTSTEVTYAESILGFPVQTVDVQATDVLLLVDGCCDGFAYKFQRVS